MIDCGGTLFFAFVLSLIIVIFFYRLKKGSKGGYDDLIVEIGNIDVKPIDKVNARLEVMKVKASELSWLERGVSTVGVIAFFAMFLTTVVQVVQSSSAMREAKLVRKEMNELRSERGEYDVLVGDITRVILNRRYDLGVDSSGQKILRHRLRFLRDNEGEDNALSEMYEVSVALGDLRSAVDLIENNMGLLESASPDLMVMFAEYYYLAGAELLSKDVLSKVEMGFSELPSKLQFRVIVLRSLLFGKKEEYLRIVAQMYKISEKEAELRISKNRAIFVAAAREYSGK